MAMKLLFIKTKNNIVLSILALLLLSGCSVQHVRHFDNPVLEKEIESGSDEITGSYSAQWICGTPFTKPNLPRSTESNAEEASAGRAFITENLEKKGQEEKGQESYTPLPEELRQESALQGRALIGIRKEQT